MNSEQWIYIVDDEKSICETLEGILQDEDYKTISCTNATLFFSQLTEKIPKLVLLDIWLPGADGMEILKEFKAEYPEIPVIMMSGHAGIEAAVNSMKLGAYDFLEKPLHLEVLLDTIEGALTKTPPSEIDELPSDIRLEIASYKLKEHDEKASIFDTDEPQQTIKNNVVLNGTGLLTGKNTGIILSPLEANKGIIFQFLDGKQVPGNITSLENFKQSVTNHTFTANSTVLSNGNRRVRTVEHLMAALHMLGIHNLLIKVEEEIPNIDGSADDFCRLIKEAGIQKQSAMLKKVRIQQKISVGTESKNEKFLYAEPFDGFEVEMRVAYDAPIFEQKFIYNSQKNSFEKEIAPARTFNTFKNIEMAQKLGKVGTGYFDSHIIIHDGKVINTELRYPDEFVRHKILDLIGDLYLIGFPIHGKFVANMTSHGYNQAIVQKIHSALKE